MTVEAFLRWYAEQPETERYELEFGTPVLMAPERLEHAAAKAHAWMALRHAADAAGLTCQAYVDGPLVRVAEDRAFQPDVVMRCGPPLPGDTVLIPDPMVVVEIGSPSTARLDFGMKFDGYLSMPSLRHYLIVMLDRRRVIHHRRPTPDAMIESRILTADAMIALEPPGIALPAAALLG
jgi:Uma2 family endonuclease